MMRLGTAARPRDRVSEIVATGFAYPGLVVDNDAFFARCRFAITSDRAALVAETRMVQRTWCGPNENTWTMAREAVRRALATGAASADEIDLVVVSSCSTIPMVSYPDPANPVVADLAPLVLAELGRDDAIGIDLKATYCAGFVRGLELVDAMLENPTTARVSWSRPTRAAGSRPRSRTARRSASWSATPPVRWCCASGQPRRASAWSTPLARRWCATPR